MDKPELTDMEEWPELRQAPKSSVGNCMALRERLLPRLRRLCMLPAGEGMAVPPLLAPRSLLASNSMLLLENCMYETLSCSCEKFAGRNLHLSWPLKRWEPPALRLIGVEPVSWTTVLLRSTASFEKLYTSLKGKLRAAQLEMGDTVPILLLPLEGCPVFWKSEKRCHRLFLEILRRSLSGS